MSIQLCDTYGMTILIFISELCLLSRISGSRTVALTILVILLFPGTIVHELAHLFVAEVLRVRTGKLTLVPESLAGSEIKTGSVAIAQTDPLRRTLIGLAPVYVGIGALTMLAYFLTSQPTTYNLQPTTILLFYIMFAVSNSMFSSKEDMKGVIPFAITVAIFAAAAYFAGFRVGLTGELLTKIILITQTLVRSLGIVLGVNLVVLAASSGVLSILRKT